MSKTCYRHDIYLFYYLILVRLPVFLSNFDDEKIIKL